MKKLLSVLLCAVMVLSLAACGKKENAPTPGPDPNGETEGLTVALVVAGKLGDRSFYDSSKEGLDRMVADLGVTPIVIECNNENHDIQMKNAAEKANIVVCVGWEFYNVETIAPDYPEVNWIWVDNATSAPVSNVLNITYAQNAASSRATSPPRSPRPAWSVRSAARMPTPSTTSSSATRRAPSITAPRTARRSAW